jgi:hypothetical protein
MPRRIRLHELWDFAQQNDCRLVIDASGEGIAFVDTRREVVSDAQH